MNSSVANCNLRSSMMGCDGKLFQCKGLHGKATGMYIRAIWVAFVAVGMTCLYGFCKNALQDLNLITKASVLDHMPGNAHMGLVRLNTVQLATWGQTPRNTDGRVANIAAKL